MHLDIDSASGRTDLRDTDDLKHLSVRVDPTAAPEAVARAFSALGQLDGADHAWIEIEALREASGRAADAAWLSGFDQMIAYASAHGWVNDAGTAVRAHIEPLGDGA